ncbi:MAG: hypothetical protein MJZ98_02440 [Paludibacteraceae bacterium]|nr:hypothetical protein [Paludibacteraceae bacterium]
MLYTFIVIGVLVALAFLLLGVKVFFVKGGRFPNTHIGASKAMKDRGITCAQSQDREAQRKK